MKRLYPVLLVVALTLPTLDVVAAPPATTSVQAAIDDYVPLWLPPHGDMAGWVVALDPSDEALPATEDRLDDDLSLLTAGHLYHLIDLAGGGAVLLRSDDTLSTRAGRDRQPQRFDAARARDCDICIFIHYELRSTSALVSAGGARPRDRQLANALQPALNARLQFDDHTPCQDAAGRPPVAAAVCCIELPRPTQAATIDVAARRACVENARRLYEGIRRYCAEAATSSASAESLPTNQKGDTPDVRGPARSLGRKIWPAGKLSDDQLDWFCRRYAEVCIADSTLVYFDVSASADDGVTLHGSTTVPRVALGLEAALRDVGVDHVRNDIRTLPDREHLGEHLFGICRAPMAITTARPGNKGGRQTQILYGEPVFLLDHCEGCYLLLAGDGYWGWTDDTAVEPLTAQQFDTYLQRPAAVLLQDINRDNIFVPRGARVRLVDLEVDAPRIVLPEGSALGTPPDTLRIETPDDSAARRVAAALELLYVPYIFGGRSPLGVDCSGLLTSAWMRDGRFPARDVWQQAFAGQLVATGWHRTNIRAGDQLFFINDSGKFYHTALALDATHFVHSSPPGVQIGSFDPRDRLYDEECDRTLIMVKRPERCH